MTNDEMDAILAPIEAREIERIEAHLNTTFGALGPIERLPVEEGYALTWRVLGSVEISRHVLPSEGQPGPEDECTVEHRSEILDAILAAYRAGQNAKAPERYERYQAAARRREDEARIVALGFKPLDLARAL